MQELSLLINIYNFFYPLLMHFYCSKNHVLPYFNFTCTELAPSICSGRGGKKSLAAHWIQGPAKSRLHPQDSVPVPLILTQLPLSKWTCHQSTQIARSTQRCLPVPEEKFLSSLWSPHCTFSTRMGNHHQDCGGGGEGCSMSSLRV